MDALANALKMVDGARVSPANRELLEAARAEFAESGFRRTSIDDIARRAGVSRRTIYRRLGDKDQIIRSVVGREVIEFVSVEGLRFLLAPTPEQRLVEVFVAGSQAINHNPIAQAALTHEREALGALILGHDPAALDPMFDAMASLLAPDLVGPPARAAAEHLLRLVATLVASPSDYLPMETEEQARALAETHFLPVIRALGSTSG